jgi:hypothetical protein
MPEPNRLTLGASTALVLSVLVSVALSAAPGEAAKSTRCAMVKSEESATCPTAFAQRRYKTLQRRLLVSIPHATSRVGLSKVVTLECPRHGKVIGGGAEIFKPYLSIRLSAPNETTTGWSVQVANASTTNDMVASVRIHVICEIGSGGRAEASASSSARRITR